MPTQTISVVDKQRLLTAYENGEDYVVLAAQLSIKKNTAAKILRRVISRGGVLAIPHGGKTDEKVDDEMRAEVEDILSTNPSITLKTLNQTLRP